MKYMKTPSWYTKKRWCFGFEAVMECQQSSKGFQFRKTILDAVFESINFIDDTPYQYKCM